MTWAKTTCQVCGRETERARKTVFCVRCAQYQNIRASLAGAKVKSAIARGVLPPITSDTRCTDCEKPARVYDHRDYDQPLVVEPVCQGCNVRRGPGALPRARDVRAYMKRMEARAGQRAREIA